MLSQPHEHLARAAELIEFVEHHVDGLLDPLIDGEFELAIVPAKTGGQRELQLATRRLRIDRCRGALPQQRELVLTDRALDPPLIPNRNRSLGIAKS